MRSARRADRQRQGEVGVWLVKAPAGSGLATGHLRSFFFEPAAWEHAEHFCRKVARDESYRGGIVKEALAFQKRDRIFERSLAWMDTSVDFGPRSAVAAGPGITAAQGRANLAAMRLAADRRDAAARELLRFVTDHLDQIEVRAGTFEPSREVLDPEIAPAVRALNAAGIKTVFSCQGIDGLVVIENVELVVQRFHEPLAYVLCSSMSRDAASRIGEHPDIWSMSGDLPSFAWPARTRTATRRSGGLWSRSATQCREARRVGTSQRRSSEDGVPLVA